MTTENDDAPIDGEAVDITPADAPTGPGFAVAVAGGPGTGQIIVAERPAQIIEKATEIADALKDLIESQHLAVDVGGRRKHVEVGGWQALGALLGALGGRALHAETVWTRKVTGADGLPERTVYTATVKRYHKKSEGGGLRQETTYDVDGFSWEAKVEVRTPDGIVVGSAEAMCSRDEETWNDRADFAVRSMAETRAESRAYRRAVGWLIHLAGYSPTPAEEMGHTPGADTGAPKWAGLLDHADPLAAEYRAALGALVTPERAVTLHTQLSADAGGGVPQIVASIVVGIHRNALGAGVIAAAPSAAAAA